MKTASVQLLKGVFQAENDAACPLDDSRGRRRIILFKLLFEFSELLLESLQLFA